MASICFHLTRYLVDVVVHQLVGEAGARLAPSFWAVARYLVVVDAGPGPDIRIIYIYIYINVYIICHNVAA